MNADYYVTLRAGINYVLEGRQCSPRGTKISAEELVTYGRGDLRTIEEAISKWECAGIVRVLKPFQSCRPSDECIEATRFIEEKSPIKGWLNWQEPEEIRSI